jgi:outer membrane protein assembly factor BamB
VVLSNNWEYAVYDAGTGARLWTMADTSGANYVTGGNRVYVLEGAAVAEALGSQTVKAALIEAFDPRTGKAVWRVPSPPSLVSLGGVWLLGSASSSLLAGALADGILVQSTADGQPLWVYQHQEQPGSSSWNVLIAGSAVYGLELYGYGQYRRRSIHAFPSTVT